MNGIWSEFAEEGLKQMQEKEKLSKESIKRIEKRVALGRKLLKKHTLFETIQLMKKEK